MYATNIQCGSIISLLGIGLGCSGPSEGFTDNPSCGQAGTFVTCTGTANVLGALCIASAGQATVQHCR